MNFEEIEHSSRQQLIEDIPVQSWDVVVIGAGPAGSYAAINLAKRNLDVLLIDGASFPRDKICGDALIPDSLKCLEKVGLLGKVKHLGFTTITHKLI